MIANLKSEKIHRILLIRLRKIGDVLLMVPAIRALRQKFPEAFVAALVNAGTEEVLSGNPLLDEILVFNPQWKKLPFPERIKKEWEFVWQVRRHRFDLVINFTEGDRGAFLSLASGAGYKIGVLRKDTSFWWKKFVFHELIDLSGVRGHVIEQLLEIPRRMGIEIQDKRLEIFYDSEDEAKINQLLSKAGITKQNILVHIHPTSHWFFKCWRDEGLAEVIDTLQERNGLQVILTSGPDQRELHKVNHIVNLCRSRPINLAGQLTLKQMAALSHRCRLFIGVDTAPMHIAAAVGTPVVALFGPSGENSWGPWGEGHIVIKKDMPCRPCGKDGCGGSKKSRCLEEITAGEVLEAAWSVLRRIDK